MWECSRKPLRTLTELSDVCLKSVLFDPPGTPGEAQNGPWRPLGRILDPLELLEASRSALGGLLGASRRPLGQKKSTLDRPLSALEKIPRQVSAKKKLLIGSWALQEEFQDRFQPS